MKIERIIGLDTLGDVNTQDDNLRFAAAVEHALKAEYPDADVVVSLSEHSEINVSDDDDFDIDCQKTIENIQDISNRVWGMADY